MYFSIALAFWPVFSVMIRLKLLAVGIPHRAANQPGEPCSCSLTLIFCFLYLLLRFFFYFSLQFFAHGTVGIIEIFVFQICQFFNSKPFAKFAYISASQFSMAHQIIILMLCYISRLCIRFWIDFIALRQ